MKDLLRIFHTNLLTSLPSRYVASGYMITKNTIMSKFKKRKKKRKNIGRKRIIHHSVPRLDLYKRAISEMLIYHTSQAYYSANHHAIVRNSGRLISSECWSD